MQQPQRRSTMFGLGLNPGCCVSWADRHWHRCFAWDWIQGAVCVRADTHWLSSVWLFTYEGPDSKAYTRWTQKYFSTRQKASHFHVFVCLFVFLVQVLESDWEGLAGTQPCPSNPGLSVTINKLRVFPLRNSESRDQGVTQINCCGARLLWHRWLVVT